MDRRRFLQAAATTSTGLVVAAHAGPARAEIPSAHVRPDVLPSGATDGFTPVCTFELDGTHWQVLEDRRSSDGALAFVSGNRGIVLERRTEAVYSQAKQPYLGLKLGDIGVSGPDLLADKLLENGDPDPIAVRDAAPPAASNFNPSNVGARLPWTFFLGNRQAGDTMPIQVGGSSRTYHVDQAFTDLDNTDLVNRRSESLLGGWVPALRKIVPIAADSYYDVQSFADVTATDRLAIQTWHRVGRIDGQDVTKVDYTNADPSFPPRREPPAESDYYRAMLQCYGYWQQQLADLADATLPDGSWTDMVKHAFAKEIMARPGGTYPKYGAVDRDYFGSEYDGFQDIFTSSLYANLEWGRFEQARAVFDGYFTEFVEDNGMVRMRGPEVGQYGLMLSLVARYVRYTGDAKTVRKHAVKVAAVAQLLVEMHSESRTLSSSDPEFGLIRGWNESDACLFADPNVWWRAYFANSGFAVRGWRDIASVWAGVDPASAVRAKTWTQHADTLQSTLVDSIRANIRHDMTPPYIGPLPGTTLTFWESLAKEDPSPQKWPHRAYTELLHADVLPDDLATTVVDCMRAYGATTLGVVANVTAPRTSGRDILGFISYGYAQELLRLDRIEEYLLFLYSHRYHAHTPGSWTAAEVAGITGSLPFFCVPAQLTVPLLVRWMLAFEESDSERLHLGRALPRDWLLSGKKIGIDHAPTRWGSVSFSLQADPARQRIDGHVELDGSRRPEQVLLRFRLPAGHKLTAVRVGGTPQPIVGTEKDTIVLTGRSARAEVTADYAN